MSRLIMLSLCLSLMATQPLYAGDASDLLRMRAMSDSELKQELKNRGVPEHLLEQASRVFRQQLNSGMIPGTGPSPQKNMLKVSKESRVSVLKELKPINSQTVMLASRPRDFERMTLMNKVTHSHAVRTSNGVEFLGQPTDFEVYGITADNHVFKTDLSASDPTKPNRLTPSGSVRSIVFDQQQLPATLYFVTEKPIDKANGEAQLQSFLDDKATLILKVTGEHDIDLPKNHPARRFPMSEIGVVWDINHGYVFTIAPTNRRVPGRTLEW